MACCPHCFTELKGKRSASPCSKDWISYQITCEKCQAILRIDITTLRDPLLTFNAERRINATA